MLKVDIKSRMFDVCEDTGQDRLHQTLHFHQHVALQPCTSLDQITLYLCTDPALLGLTSILAGAWVEGMVEEDGQDAGVLEEGEDISKNSAFGPASPSTPSTPMAISQSHKKS